MNVRREFYPDFYKSFRCVAGQCPDTCCKDWDIVVDGESYEFYSNVPGELGKKLVENIRTDEDGDRVFILKNSFCPFLNSDKLCDIQLRFGEERVCNTCRAFPRLTQDYTEFVEYMLSLACPEACRMIINSNKIFDFSDITQIQNNNNGYSKAFMNFLLKARAMTADIFKDNTTSFQTQLKQCISFSEYVQSLIDKDIFDNNMLCKFEYQDVKSENISRNFVFEMHRNLDIMDKKWLDDLCNSSNYVLNDNFKTDCEYRRLALYYIYRYYITAIDSYDIITTIKRLYCSYIVCSAMTAKLGAENDFNKRVLILQKYSKEIEHSFENIEFLTDEFVLNPNFFYDNLLKTI